MLQIILININRFILFFSFIIFIFCNFLSAKTVEELKKDFSSIYIDKITFKVDIPFSQEEFFYLTNLKEKIDISIQEIEKAYEQLQLKNRFSQIEVEIKDEKNGKNLHFDLNSNWIFKHLTIKGILFGKHHFSNLYLQQPGDIFDLSLHEESIKSIKHYLCDKGYFNCNISDELIYSKNDKSIIAKVIIKKNKKFKFGKILFNVEIGKKDDLFEKTTEFDAKLLKKIGSKLMDKNYSKNAIKNEIEKIKLFFKKHGFTQCHIKVKRLVNKKDQIAQINFYIQLGVKRELIFQGNTLFSENQISQDIVGLELPSWYFSPEIIKETISNEYYDKGYWDTYITHQKISENKYLFKIEENSPTLISGIFIKDLSDNNFYQFPMIFNELLKKRICDLNLLQECLDKLKSFYLSYGFWNFTIIDKQFIKDEKNKSCTITITIKKGDQRFLGDIKIENFPELEKNSFFQKYSSETKSGKLVPFNFFWLQEQKTYLTNQFQQKGYWYSQIYPEFIFEPSSNTENTTKSIVTWKINLGPQIKFGKFFLKGDTKIPFKKIKKEMQFKEGELWDRKKLESTKRRLKKLDLFKHIQIQPYKISNDNKNLNQPVLLTLVDDDPIQATIRAGYFLTSKNFLFKRESTFKIGSSLIIKNPTNNTDKLSFNADLTRFDRKLDANYQIPSPFGLTIGDSSVMGKAKIYANKYVHPVEILQSESAFEAIQNGFLLGLNNEYQDGYFLGINVGNEWVNTSKVRGNLKFSQNLINKTLPYFFLEPNIIIDKLDDKLDVKKGSLSFFSIKFIIPEYLNKPTSKLMFEQSFFYPIYDQIIGGARLRIGHILNQDFETVQPIERFYLGGPYSVRGYERDAIPPLGISEKINPDGSIKKKYTIQGGSSMVNGNLELRFPIYKSFRGVIFQDIGVLSQSGFMGFKGKWFPSSGFGLRYKTPIGALRFDIGWKWKNRLTGDTSYAWYLTLGEAF